MHIAVLGLGPAGAVLAHRAVARGWTVDGYDPACRESDGALALPDWPGTYGLPLADLPDWARDILPLAGPAHRLTAHTPGRHDLGYGPYGLVDRAALRRRLTPGIRLHRVRIRDARGTGAGGTAADGTGGTGTGGTADAPLRDRLGVDAVVDCRGVVDRPGAVRQVAYGLFLPPETAAAAGLTTGEFMDWRPSPAVADCPDSSDRAPRTAAAPSFLYVQRTADGVLVEETVLATRARSRDLLPELRRRLEARLGDAATQATGTETVHFPMDRRYRPWYLGPDTDGYATFGAAGGLTHPATGYSVAAAAAAADTALDQLVDGAPRGRRLSAALAWRLRLLGAELLVRADGDVLPRFFDAFFRLPTGLQRGYLAGQDAAPVAAAMVSLAAFPRAAVPFLRPLPRALYYTLKPR